MKISCRKILLVVVCVIISFVLVSCYKIETNNKLHYTSFYNKMKERDSVISDLFPELTSDYIEETYLYFSDWDLFDSYYAAYLVCTYPKNEYSNEVKRVESLYSDMEQIKNAYSSDNYNSISWDDDLIEPDYISLGYVLFDEENSRIVYVAVFEEELYGKSTNIPEKYLPKQLINMRTRQGTVLCLDKDFDVW